MKAALKIILATPFLALSALCQSSEQGVSDQGSGSGAIPVEVIRDGKRWTLLRDGKPYIIEGAGTNGGNIAELAAHGGNSFRNWRDLDSPDGLPLLDEALSHGLTVAMCLPIGRERHGFDYDDPEAVRRQFEGLELQQPQSLRCHQRHLENDP
jgi:hypothetical protein